MVFDLLNLVQVVSNLLRATPQVPASPTRKKCARSKMGTCRERLLRGTIVNRTYGTHYKIHQVGTWYEIYVPGVNLF